MAEPAPPAKRARLAPAPAARPDRILVPHEQEQQQQPCQAAGFRVMAAEFDGLQTLAEMPELPPLNLSLSLPPVPLLLLSWRCGSAPAAAAVCARPRTRVLSARSWRRRGVVLGAGSVFDHSPTAQAEADLAGQASMVAKCRSSAGQAKCSSNDLTLAPVAITCCRSDRRSDR